jgi:bacillithiol biosynthesis cysteine-adding enzyme BshC
MFINFSDIPGHQNLFLDYLNEFNNLKSFYKYNFRDRQEYPQVFKSVSESPRAFREDVADIIQSQYVSKKISPKTAKNISLLKNKKTLAVVTGQQLGMLGGPMYTFYKIITAVKLSKHLSERYDDYEFVPVFWLEGDDHDFEEISEIKLINDNNELVKIQYSDNAPEGTNRGSVGYQTLLSTINSFFDEVDKNIRKTDFTKKIMDNLKSFYSEGKTFKQAFSDLLYWLFDQHGLIIFDPQDKKIKKLLTPVFQKEIAGFREHTAKLVEVSATLEGLYHAQVKVRPVNLFLNYEEGRYLIEPVENEFRLRGKRKKYTFEELNSLIQSEPENFSPNVLLRPICQDYILPTAFYVGGPSEIAYFAQVMPLYEIFNVPSPVIFPRSSATLVEKNVGSAIDKFDLKLHDIFADPELLKNNIVSKMSEGSLENIFSKSTYEMELIFDKLQEILFEIDKTMSELGNKYKLNSLNSLNQLKAKAVEAQKKKYETSLRQIDKITVNLYPDKNLQEREINFLFYANKYGLDIVNRIYEELEINVFEHQVIYL